MTLINCLRKETTTTMEIPIIQSRSSDPNRPSDVEFEEGSGTCYLWCCGTLVTYGLCLLPGYCFARKFMSSQRVLIDDKRINYKSDCWLCRTDKLVPLERIQDVNIQEDCVARCCGVATISIQTAGGSERAEITIIAPKNPKEVRDRIMATRDAFVNNQSGGGLGDSALGDNISSRSPLLTSNSQDVAAVNQTLLRMEKLLDKGIERLASR